MCVSLLKDKSTASLRVIDALWHQAYNHFVRRKNKMLLVGAHMDYRRLGNTGLRVSPICLGCMTFGREIDRTTSEQIMHHALEAGINFFDTANVYAQGASEEIVGPTLKAVRSQVVLATKFYGETGDAPNDRGGSRYNIMNAIEASLRRLQTDHVDLYQIHRFDPATPLDETLRALDDLVCAGKVRYIGCSNFAAWQIAKALWISDVHQWNKFVAVQPRFSLIYREPEQELLPLCADQGLGVIPYSPLAGGALTGKYKPGQPLPPDSRFAQGSERARAIYLTDKNYRVIAALEKYAAEHGTPKEQLAIAWVLSHPAVTAPIIGAKSVAHLDTALKADALKMTQAERNTISQMADEA
jgi:aryl-alcohol dehydrogenase-like predicted oxidoreductase